MIGEAEKLLVYFEDEAHLVRRLGAAVVAHWAQMPDAIRRILIDHAKLVLDEDDSGDIDSQITRFIDVHTTMPLMA